VKRLFPIFCLAAALFGQTAVIRTVTVTEGTNIAATVSPDQSTIVFDLQGVLWSIPFQGGTAKRLTDPFLEPARPDYSPKGGAIAFEAYRGGTFHIWTMHPDGSGLRQLTNGHGDDRDPRFSPDGTKIAFSSDRAFHGSYDIWVIDLASGKLTQWTKSSNDEFEPAWSPDGSEIAFVSGVGNNGKTIEAMNASGAERTLATAPPGARLNSPSFSPDGKKIAYVQFASNKSILMISGVHAGTGDDVFPFFPDWLPGNRILYAGNGKIRLTTLDHGETRDIPFQAEFTLDRPAYRHKKFNFDSPTPQQAKGIVSPTLSPDGKRVVFEALNQLWLMDVGGKPQPLTNDKFYKEDPAWSPDGKKLAYSSDKAGTEDIYILDLGTKKEKRVTPFDDSAEVSAAWSPDGRMLAYQNQFGATFILDLATGAHRQVVGPLFAPSKPSWSANGKTIAIAALKAYTHRFREGTSQILTADVASGAVTYTEPAPFGSLSTRGEDGPIYSPDGSSLAFVMQSVLWVRPVDANGVPAGPARQVNHEVTDAPTWSGDSKHLLYLSNAKLRMISLDGSNPVTVPLDLTWRNASAPPQRTIIHAGRLWDGRGADERTNVDIIVVNGRIQAIEPHRERSASDGNIRLVDASNLTVIPGLWETHTHEWISGKFYGDRLGRLWLSYGVTELQSEGDPAYRAVETREAFASGDRLGPRFFASGEAIDGERIYYNFMRPTLSEAQLKLELSRAQALDYDLLKTYVRLPHAMQKEAMTFAHDKIGIVTASHYMLPGMAYGMDVMTHVSATARLGFAYTRSAAGVSYQDMRSLFEASGMTDISTSFSSSALYAEDPAMVDDQRLTTLNTPWDEKILEARSELESGKKLARLPEGMRRRAPNPALTLDSLKKEEETVGAILHGGGVMLAGTDSPLDAVATALHLNLRAQVKYGIEPWRALQTATFLAAKAFGAANDLGTVEPGKLADLTMVAGDPLQNIKDAAAVRLVMKGGKLYSIPELMKPFEMKEQSASR
jgi:Tol biopolymer transport system component